MIRIPLDPTKTPLENAKRYFEKYNKMKRTYEALSHLIVETRTRSPIWNPSATHWTLPGLKDDLAQVKEELTQSGYVRRKFTKKKEKFKSMPLHYISSDGYDMYVGKNNFQNEELTFSFASGNDWWFHAKKKYLAPMSLSNPGEKKCRTVSLKRPESLPLSIPKIMEAKGRSRLCREKACEKGQRPETGFVIYHTNYSLIADTDISMLKEVSES